MSKQNIKNKKGVALDDLTGMIQQGFESVEKRLSSHDEQFKSINVRFQEMDEKMDLHFDILSGRIKDLSVRKSEEYYNLDRRVTRLERKASISK